MNKPLDKQLTELDMFSLLLFRTLYESGQANIAARQLDVSAPKVSRTLATLRIIFADELFYRRQQGFKPTPLAEEIYPAVRALTDSIQQLGMRLKDHQANGQQGHSVLDIGVSSGLLASLALAFNHRSDSAPTVVLHQWQETSTDKLHRGELDLGLALEPDHHSELTYERLCDATGLCLVAAKNHPIWQNQHLSLEHICEFPFLCTPHPGFNDRMDPLELFCQREGLNPPPILRVSDREEWYAHLLCQGSLALVSPLEWQLLSSLPGIIVNHLNDQELERLYSGIATPGLYLVEKPAHHRRYTARQRQQILTVFTHALALPHR